MITVLLILIIGGMTYYMLKPRKVKIAADGQMTESKLWSFNEQSWHAKYYKWLLSTKKLPKGGCPYFWTLVGMSLLLIILSPIVGVVKLVELIIGERKEHTPEWHQKNYDRQQRRELRGEKIGKIATVFAKVILGLFIGAGLIVLTYGVATQKNLWWLLLLAIVSAVIFILIMLLIVWLWTNYNVGGKIINSKVIQIPKSMMIAIYTRACPKITWSKSINNEKQEIPQI